MKKCFWPVLLFVVIVPLFAFSKTEISPLELLNTIEMHLDQMNLEDIHSLTDSELILLKNIVRLKEPFLKALAQEEGIVLKRVRTPSLYEGVMSFYEYCEKHGQKELAQKFHFSLSTVFNSLKTPRKIQAIEAGGRNFILRDPEKLLYLWAVQRNLDKDILYQTRVEKSVLEIEGLMPNSIIYGLYSAFRKRIQTLPADYDKVYVYIPEKNLKEIQERF